MDGSGPGGPLEAPPEFPQPSAQLPSFRGALSPPGCGCWRGSTKTPYMGSNLLQPGPCGIQGEPSAEDTSVGGCRDQNLPTGQSYVTPGQDGCAFCQLRL